MEHERKLRMFKINPKLFNTHEHLGNETSCSAIAANVLNFPSYITQHLVANSLQSGITGNLILDAINEVEKIYNRPKSMLVLYGMMGEDNSRISMIDYLNKDPTGIVGDIEKIGDHNYNQNKTNVRNILNIFFSKLMPGTGTILSMQWCSGGAHSVVILKSISGKPYLIDSQQRIDSTTGTFESMDHFFDHTGCVYGVMDYFNQPSCKVKYFIVPEVYDDLVIDFGEYNNKIPGSRQLLSNRVPSDEPMQGQHTYFSNLPGIHTEPQNIHEQQFGEGLSIYTMPPLQIPEKQGGRKQRKTKEKQKEKQKENKKKNT